MTFSKKSVACAVLAAGLASGAGDASARVFVGVGLGGGYYPGYAYAPPVYYAPPPAYYAPPAYAYPPPAYPGYGYAPPQQAPVYGQSTPYCREYNDQAVVNGVNQEVHGTACQQPDGSWRVVQ